MKGLYFKLNQLFPCEQSLLSFFKKTRGGAVHLLISTNSNNNGILAKQIKKSLINFRENCSFRDTRYTKRKRKQLIWVNDLAKKIFSISTLKR